MPCADTDNVLVARAVSSQRDNFLVEERVQRDSVLHVPGADKDNVLVVHAVWPQGGNECSATVTTEM